MPPPGSSTGSGEKEVPHNKRCFWGRGAQWILALSSFHSCALLDERKLHACVFFFLHDFSFPKTKALTILLAPPEKFTKEAEGGLK